MFDRSKPNVILLTDVTMKHALQKSAGAYKVAHELRQAGFEVLVIAHLHAFTAAEIGGLLDRSVNENTLFVGVSNTFYNRVDSLSKKGGTIIDTESAGAAAMLPHGSEHNQAIASIIKRRNPNCKLVLGGALAGVESENRIYDYLVIGYADRSVVNLARHLHDSSVPLENAHKSVFGPIVVNDKTAKGFDFASSSMRYRDEDVILPGETLPIEIARGCIFKCAFCSYPLNGKKRFDYIRNEEILYEEILENYERFGITQYMFSDDTFNDSVEKCEMIYRISRKLPFRIQWWSYLRLDLMAAHPETIDLLANAGMRAAFFGIETFHKESGSAIGKGAGKDKLVSTINTIKRKYGNQIALHGSFIFGLPKEPLSSMVDTANFLMSNECGLDTWLGFPLRLNERSGKQYTGADLNAGLNFLSDLEMQPERYGYSFDAQGNWSNEHCDSLQVQELTKDLAHKKMKAPGAKLSGGLAFNISGLGIPLDQLINAPLQSVNFAAIARLKAERAALYKAALSNHLDLGALTQ